MKRSHQLSDAADVLLREAEAALFALRATMRQAPIPSETKHPGKQIRLLSYHVLSRRLQVGDRFSDETGEWEVASRPHLTAGGKVTASVGLVDIGLPDFDGYEVARRLRTKLGATIRLIALTGYGQPEDRRRVIEAGFDAHVVKPVDPNELPRILKA